MISRGKYTRYHEIALGQAPNRGRRYLHFVGFVTFSCHSGHLNSTLSAYADMPYKYIYTLTVCARGCFGCFLLSSLRPCTIIAGQASVEVDGGGDDAGAVHPQGRRVAAGPQDGLGRAGRGRGPPPQEQPLQAQRRLPRVLSRVSSLFGPYIRWSAVAYCCTSLCYMEYNTVATRS